MYKKGFMLQILSIWDMKTKLYNQFHQLLTLMHKLQHYFPSTPNPLVVI